MLWPPVCRVFGQCHRWAGFLDHYQLYLRRLVSSVKRRKKHIRDFFITVVQIKFVFWIYTLKLQIPHVSYLCKEKVTVDERYKCRRNALFYMPLYKVIAIIITIGKHLISTFCD